MNVSELTASIFGTQYNNTSSVSRASSALAANSANSSSVGDSVTSTFSDILSGYVTNASGTAEALSETVNSLSTNQNTAGSNTSGITGSTLTDTLSAEDTDSTEDLSTEDLSEELLELLSDSDDSSSSSDTDVMSILTDAQKAQEYLSSQSGRNVILSMVENQIAGIVTGSES